ncbi:MAG: HlyD family secretion protein, partial [Polyangiaceae bacterium]|nr:HlyD family secretion protein [Polyangiaceae bacterium]
LRVGALVEVGVAGSAPVDAVIVPASALVDRGGQPAVIVKTAPETFEVRPVRLGPRAGASVGIAAGVRPGERVVVEGAMAVLLAAGG